MPRPEVNIIAERVYEELAPIATEDEANDWALLHFVHAWTNSMMEIEEIVRDTDDGPGWSSVLDVDRAPEKFLDFLSMFVGREVLPGETAQEKRDLIEGVVNHRRGSAASSRALASKYLTGDKFVIFNERQGGSAWRYSVRVRNTELPESDIERFNLATNPKAGGGATTGWTNTSLTTFEAVTLDGATHPDPLTLPDGQVIDTAFHCVGNAAADRAVIPFPVVSGQQYDLAVYVWVETLSAGSVAIQVEDALGNTEISGTLSQGGATTTTGQWIRLREADNQPFTADATENWDLWVRQNGAGAADFYFTAVLIEKSDALGDYFDGSFSGSEWQGTPHASTSRRIPTTIVHNALKSQKPAGDILDFDSYDPESVQYDEIFATYDTYQEILEDPDYPTYFQVLTTEPTPEP